MLSLQQIGLCVGGWVRGWVSEFPGAGAGIPLMVMTWISLDTLLLF